LNNIANTALLYLVISQTQQLKSKTEKVSTSCAQKSYTDKVL